MRSDPSLVYQQLVGLAASRGMGSDFYNLGCALHDSRRWGAAAGCFARAIEGDAGDFRALANYGWNLHLTGRSEEGRFWLEKSLTAKEDEGTTHALLSQVLATLGDREGAIEHGWRGVELEPAVPLNHVAYSFALMKAGEWLEGLREFEHRFAYELPEFLTRPYRLWRGERVKRLYIEGEMGSGDTLQGLRWLPLAAERCDELIFYVQRELYGLVAGMGLPGNVSVHPLPRPLPEADAWSPVWSLPAALELRYPWDAGVPPYIPGYMSRKHGETLRVGIAWAGSVTHEQAHNRDCPLAYWFPLTEVSGARLHSLQVGEAAQQLGDLGAYGLITDRGPELSNFRDTAEVIAGLDLVISVDTSVAHLAGAMGAPCWLLLNERGQDFRWGYEGDRTPWYPSVRAFRRGLHEDWASVIGRVAAQLREAA